MGKTKINNKGVTVNFKNYKKKLKYSDKKNCYVWNIYMNNKMINKKQKAKLKNFDIFYIYKIDTISNNS